MRYPFPEVPDNIDQILRLMRDNTSCVTAIRYYHYDHLSDVLSSAFSVGGPHRGSFSPQQLIRHNDGGKLDEAFAAIQMDRPVIVTVDPAMLIDQVNCTPNLSDPILHFYFRKDPCPELATGAGRRWFDIAVQTGVSRRQPVGKLSCSVTADAPIDQIVEAINIIGVWAQRYSAFIECMYLRTLYLPLHEIEALLSHCTSVPQLVAEFVNEVPRRLIGTQAAMLFFQQDRLGVKQLSMIHSQDRYLSDDWIKNWQQPIGVIQTEEDALCWVAERKRPLALHTSREWVVATDEDDLLPLAPGFRFKNGNFGSLLLFPIVHKENTLGVVSLRRCDDSDGEFSDSETLMLSRLCGTALPQRLIALRNDETTSVIGPLSDASPPGSLRSDTIGETDSGAYRELIRSLGASLERLFPGQGCRRAFVVNLLEPDGKSFRHHHFGGTLADKASTDISLPLNGSFTKFLLDGEDDVAVLNDIAIATSLGHCHPRYLDAICAIGVRIAFNGRPYGTFAVLSDRADLHFLIYAPRLRFLGAQAAALLAHREVLDCSFEGLKNDVLMVVRSVQRTKELTKTTQTMLLAAVSVVQSCAELTRMERFIPLSECRPVNVFAEVDMLQQIVQDVGIVNQVDPEFRISMHRTIVRMLLYKVFLGMRGEARAQIVVGVTTDQRFCHLSFQLSGDQGCGERIREAIELPLVEQLTGTRQFRNGWMSGFRLARSLAIQHSFGDGREGQMTVHDIRKDSCQLIAKIPHAVQF